MRKKAHTQTTLKIDPLTVILMIAVIVGSYTGGFFHGKAVESKPVYEIDVIYTEVETDVEATVESHIENVQRSDQIVEVANYTIDGKLVFMTTNVLTNTQNLSNTSSLSNATTNYSTNLIKTDMTNAEEWFDGFIQSYLSNQTLNQVQGDERVDNTDEGE